MKTFEFMKYLLISAVAVFGLVSCSEENKAKEEEPVHKIKLEELEGEWIASQSYFDLSMKGTGYLLDIEMKDPAQDGFMHDEKGDYITISIQDYCEQYAKDYNADSKNTDKITAEDVAYREYDKSISNKFTVMKDYFMLEQGKAGFLATMIMGKSVWSDAKQSFIITQEIEGEKGKVVEVKVEKGRVDGEYKFLVTSEWYPFYTGSYDKKKEYWFLAPTWYFCKLAEVQ